MAGLTGGRPSKKRQREETDPKKKVASLAPPSAQKARSPKPPAKSSPRAGHAKANSPRNVKASPITARKQGRRNSSEGRKSPNKRVPPPKVEEEESEEDLDDEEYETAEEEWVEQSDSDDEAGDNDDDDDEDEDEEEAGDTNGDDDDDDEEEESDDDDEEEGDSDSDVYVSDDVPFDAEDPELRVLIDADRSGYSSEEEEDDADEGDRSTLKKNASGKATNITTNAEDDDEDEPKPVLQGLHPHHAANKVDLSDSDLSEDEDETSTRNRIGNVPLEWYEEHEHIGYNIDGERVAKGVSGNGTDQLDRFLEHVEDPSAQWRRVYDRENDRDVVLKKEDIDVLRRIQAGKFPIPGTSYNEPLWETKYEDSMHPISNRPEPKSRFIPSKWEAKRVAYLVQAIRRGWIQADGQSSDIKAPSTYLMWDAESDLQGTMDKRMAMHIPAPKLALPVHSESYNPAPEYLLSDEEKKQWRELDPTDRVTNYMPAGYDCLRHVPQYRRFIRERFNRCLDLYLCPRARRMRQNVNPKDLLPSLPKPSELKPYPNSQNMVFRGHTDYVRSITIDPTGQFVASGSDDGTVRVWEISTGRCVRSFNLTRTPSSASTHVAKKGKKIQVNCVAWCPNPQVNVIAVACGDRRLMFLNPGTGSKQQTQYVNDEVLAPQVTGSSRNVTEWLMTPSEEEGLDEDEDEEAQVDENGDEKLPLPPALRPDGSGVRVTVAHPKAVSFVTWHHKGDYLASLCPDGGTKSVMVHQLSKRSSQCPFKKAKGDVQAVKFHPTKPLFFVATQRHVRVYNLMKQSLVKKLLPGVKWISSIDIHSGGDNLIIGSYDKRVCWFDLDLSKTPYRTLRYHKQAVRHVSYHQTLPLFSSCSDDNTIHIFHGRVYNDLLSNPLIVPVKILRGHDVVDGIGIMDCKFHPKQPWLVSSGADGTVRLFTDF